MNAELTTSDKTYPVILNTFQDGCYTSRKSGVKSHGNIRIRNVAELPMVNDHSVQMEIVISTNYDNKRVKQSGIGFQLDDIAAKAIARELTAHMAMTGEQLYALWRKKHAERGCDTDAWLELDQDDRDVWSLMSVEINFVD